MPFFEITPLKVDHKMQRKPTALRAKKILEEVHPLHIIAEVQKRPGLYSRECPESASPHHRTQLWSEVARVVLPGWHTYSKLQKQTKLSDLIKKWRNLRDTFKRQLEVEKKIKEGHDIKKKTYVYYKHMSFLLPHLSSNDEESTPSKALDNARKRHVTATSTLSPAVDDIDEDRHFLMSLIPSFRRMTDDEKLTVKMEILKVIRNVRDLHATTTAADALAVIADDDVKQEIILDLDIDEPAYQVADIEDASNDELE
ncbi:hypothetical protein evm_011878 [Chilo suppressalis]|nr:hypothetical protein evm_011878 [Chilo suppressalis]